MAFVYDTQRSSFGAIVKRDSWQAVNVSTWMRIHTGFVIIIFHSPRVRVCPETDVPSCRDGAVGGRSLDRPPAVELCQCEVARSSVFRRLGTFCWSFSGPTWYFEKDGRQWWWTDMYNHLAVISSWVLICLFVRFSFVMFSCFPVS